MYCAEIVKAVEQLKKKYHESDPFRLCKVMGIKLLFQSLGIESDCVKGFFLEFKRIRTITVNDDLPLLIQKFIVAHELGHAVLHRKQGISAFHELALYDESSLCEKDANLFAAELLLEDDEVLQALNEDNTFFTAAAMLNVPPELLDFKFRVLKWKGYKIVESPIISRSNFLKDLDVSINDDFSCKAM